MLLIGLSSVFFHITPRFDEDKLNNQKLNSIYDTLKNSYNIPKNIKHKNPFRKAKKFGRIIMLTLRCLCPLTKYNNSQLADSGFNPLPLPF